jgi:2-polyprenyl-3-methyl-5-hydroxy-6-metoxy-1,4-benzoquinol methylase
MRRAPAGVTTWLAGGTDPPKVISVADGESYYTHQRPEVVSLVPEDVRQVVDIGCGAGALGASIKRARPKAQVRGVEYVPSQAERAKLVLDDAVAADASAPPPVAWPVPDCLVFADVLEHLVDPWATLATWRERAAPQAWAVMSIPNVSHTSVVSGLKRGRFDYADEGLLDRTHLRFFTRLAACDMVEKAGFEILRMERTFTLPGRAFRRGVLNAWVKRRYKPEVARASFFAPRHSLVDSLTNQFLILARKR